MDASEEKIRRDIAITVLHSLADGDKHSRPALFDHSGKESKSKSWQIHFLNRLCESKIITRNTPRDRRNTTYSIVPGVKIEDFLKDPNNLTRALFPGSSNPTMSDFSEKAIAVISDEELRSDEELQDEADIAGSPIESDLSLESADGTAEGLPEKIDSQKETLFLMSKETLYLMSASIENIVFIRDKIISIEKMLAASEARASQEGVVMKNILTRLESIVKSLE